MTIISPIIDQDLPYSYADNFSRDKIMNDMTLIPSKIKHDDSVDLEKLAKMTVGFSGADLQNMVNRVSLKNLIVIFSKGLIGIRV